MLHSQADKRRRIVYIQLGEQILSVAVDCQRADEQFLRYLGIGKAQIAGSPVLNHPGNIAPVTIRAVSVFYFPEFIFIIKKAYIVVVEL